MKTLAINSRNLAATFEEFKSQLGGRLEINSKEFKLEIDSDLVKGSITGMAIENAISYIEYNIISKEDFKIKYDLSQSNLLHFTYCAKGQLSQQYNLDAKENWLNQFQTGIFSSASNNENNYSFNKNEKTKVSIISVDVSVVADRDLKSQLENSFQTNQENDLSYLGSLNLKIFDKIEQLTSINQKGLVRSLLVNSTVYHILALEIEQYRKDLSSPETCLNMLTIADMESVKEISSFVKGNPEIQYSLKFLCKKSGLSPVKLQEGFKILHERTVTDFIRNVRIEAAENLIRTSELNISEIVYTIGLTSRSYFSKIFKEKYNCSPKHYQNQLNVLIVNT